MRHTLCASAIEIQRNFFIRIITCRAISGNGATQHEKLHEQISFYSSHDNSYNSSRHFARFISKL